MKKFETEKVCAAPWRADTLLENDFGVVGTVLLGFEDHFLIELGKNSVSPV